VEDLVNCPTSRKPAGSARRHRQAHAHLEIADSWSYYIMCAQQKSTADKDGNVIIDNKINAIPSSSCWT
jgi:hypothetical protein